MPEQTLDQSSLPPVPEKARTPRQRVEDSIDQRSGMAHSLNRLLSPETTERYEDWALSHPEDIARTEELRNKLIEQNTEFLEKIVSNLPEAQAWEELAKEKWEEMSDNARLKSATGGYGIEYNLRERNIEEFSRDYVAAMENVKRVRERTSSATPK